MNNVASQIRKRLRPLIGLKLSIARRAADLRNFHFGEVRTVDRGTVGEYALHIQCPWRMEGQRGIITGRSDLWEPDTKAMSSQRPGWTYEDGNLQDERLGFLLKGYDPQTRSLMNETGQFVVEDIEADACGGAAITLSGGYRLVLFPAGTQGESWRFFRPGDRAGHFVVEDGAVSSHV